MHKIFILLIALMSDAISFADYPATQGYQVSGPHEHHHHNHHRDHHRREYTEGEKIVIQQSKDRLEVIKQEREGYHYTTDFCYLVLAASIVAAIVGAPNKDFTQIISGALGAIVFGIFTKMSRDGDFEQAHNRDKEEKELLHKLEEIEKSLEHHHRHHH